MLKRTFSTLAPPTHSRQAASGQATTGSLRATRVGLILIAALAACMTFAGTATASASTWACERVQNNAHGELVFRCHPRGASGGGKDQTLVVVEGKWMTLNKAEAEAGHVDAQAEAEDVQSAADESGSASGAEVGIEDGLEIAAGGAIEIGLGLLGLLF